MDRCPASYRAGYLPENPLCSREDCLDRYQGGYSAELGMHFTQVATVTGILAWSVTCVIHHLSIWNGVHACRLLQEAVE